MKKYINRRIMIISTAAILLTAVFCTYAYYYVFREEVMDELRICSSVLRDQKILEDEEDLARCAETLYDDNIRLTLIGADGEVIFDNIASVKDLDNHRNRKEIEQALREGEGYSVRRSETINRTNYYYAIRLDDGSILRTARESHSIINIFLHAIPVIALAVLLLLIICYYSSYILTKNLVAPIESLAENISHPEQVCSYEELQPVIEHIQKQHMDVMEYANLRQTFTANVSHELKTPLTAIAGYSELIETGMAEGGDAMKFAGEIHKNADRLLTLINDILRLSEFDVSREEDVELMPVDLYETAKGCAEMLELKAAEHGVTIHVEGEKTMVMANGDMMEEVLYNLCDNAIRYNHEGGYVRLIVRDRMISVEDNGIGIPEEYHDRIFERFFRVDKSRSKQTGGTGLGLAIVKHISTLNNALLTLESKPGEGTVISLSFSEDSKIAEEDGQDYEV